MLQVAVLVITSLGSPGAVQHEAIVFDVELTVCAAVVHKCTGLSTLLDFC